MTDQKKQREHLVRYTHVARNFELAGAAISLLEGVQTREAKSAVNILQRGQQALLKKLDATAEKLGAPF